MAAWRAYRARSVRWARTSPLIWLTRALRDAWLSAYHRALGHRPYAAVRAEMRRQAAEGADRGKVPIAFLGLFDTVEAYGVPIEEMRRAIDWAVWPISFRNRELSSSVLCARHALSLDEERTTFQPIRFDTRKDRGSDRIREIWFAGVHSDVGGGYPDGELSYVPLLWMAKEAQAKGLRFTDGALKYFAATASPFGPIHDSRSGLSVAYRYHPRSLEGRISRRPVTGLDGVPHLNESGTPVVHRSVVAKMTLGSERYAPMVLPKEAELLLDDGSTAPLTDSPETREALRTEAMHIEALHAEASRAGTEAVPGRHLPDLSASERLPSPNEAFIALTQDGVWWRRVAYMLLFAAVLAVLLLPVIAEPLTTKFRDTVGVLAELLGKREGWNGVWAWLAGASDDVGSTIGAATAHAGGLIPSYLTAYVEILARRPLTCLAVLGIAAALYQFNGSLRDFIADKARCAWFYEPSGPGDGGGTIPASARPSLAMRFARLMRTAWSLKALHGLATRFVLPACFVALMAAGAAVLVNWVAVTTLAGQSAYCRKDPWQPPAALGEHGEVAWLDRVFPTNDLCWPTGVQIERGRHYVLRMTVVEPFFDMTVPAGVTGFKNRSPVFLLASPFARILDADWFQPIARIGEKGGLKFKIVPIDGAEPSSAEPLEIGKPERHPVPPPRGTLVTEFTATTDGELFLFVNDVLIGVPLLRDLIGFYGNNGGKARIVIAKTALPDFAQPTPP